MRNISRIYTGAVNTEATVLTSSSGTFTFRWTVKHNPSSSGYWMGFDKNYPTFQLFGFPVDFPANAFQLSNSGAYINQNLTFAGTCGNVVVNAASTGVTSAPISSASNFNNIVLSSNYLLTPVTTTVTSGSTTCTTKIATASVNTIGNVASIEWRYDDNLLSSTSTLTVITSEVRTYAIIVTLDSGCVITKTVTF